MASPEVLVRKERRVGVVMEFGGVLMRLSFGRKIRVEKFQNQRVWENNSTQFMVESGW
jgi:hypothetical protein